MVKIIWNLLFSILLIFVDSNVMAQSTQTYGNPTVSEGCYAVTADNSGFMYSGGFSNSKGIIVKTNQNGNAIWSKELNLNLSNNFNSTVSALDVVADTLFGCGFISSPSNPNSNGTTTSGGFYFKMNKNTGTIYWIKYENVSDIYLSGMRYSEGKYFLIGARTNQNSVYDGNVLCVSSTTGDYIWQSNTFSLVFSNFNNDYIDDLMGMSEIVNGQFFITGRSYVNSTQYNMRPTLVGFDVNGNRFLTKYLLVNQTAGGNNRYYGMNIAFDGTDRLVISYFGDGNCTGSCNTYNVGILKTDLNGNIIFSHDYDIIGSTTEYAKNINVTDNAYVISGSSNFTSANAKFIALKVDKNGVLQKTVSISKPGTTNQMTMSGINLGGTSKFINGMHYFGSAIHSGNATLLDMFMIQLDEDLNTTNPCFEVELINASTIVVPPFSSDLVDIEKGFSFASPLSGSSNTDYNVVDQCNASDISYLETFYGCDSLQVDILSATNVQYDINWSSGNIGSSATFSASDTVIIEYFDPINCCSFIDTFDFQIGVNLLDMSLPNDTVVCINLGGTHVIEPLITNCNGCDILWNDNSTNSTLTVSNTGWYSAEVSNSCGSSIQDSIFIELNQNPIYSFDNQVDICSQNNTETILTINTEDNVVWWDGTMGENYSVSEPGTYSFSVSNSCGILNDFVLVSNINCAHPEIIVPNVFTPNGDGVNGLFTINVKNIAQLKLVILNRWGNLMNSLDQDVSLLDEFIGWDGTTQNGSEANEGTYFYKYLAIDVNGNQLDGHGFLQLVR